MTPSMRADFSTIAGWVAPSSRVLDLGCGDGSLLSHLRASCGASGYGIETTMPASRLVSNGINVLQSDLESGLAGFDDQSFDTVILSQRCRRCGTSSYRARCCVSAAKGLSRSRISATGHRTR
jgi:methionine biosynthesis protein MetW